VARIKLKKQEKIDQSNERKNDKRLCLDYQVGDKILLSKPGIIWKMTHHALDHLKLSKCTLMGLFA
jgi:hypothetical protein